MILTNQRTASSHESETPKKQNNFLNKLKKLRRRSAPPSTRPATSASGHLIIDIEDFDADTFRRLISYLHSGSINVNIDSVIGRCMHLVLLTNVAGVVQRMYFGKKIFVKTKD